MKNRGRKNNNTIKDIILKHINNNLKEYIFTLLIFIVGVICGVIFVNNANEQQINEISTYLNDFLQQLKTNYEIDTTLLLKNSLISNFWLTVLIWFMGSTIIGIPLVYIIIAYRGFCLSYTISASILVFGIGKGILFTSASILLQNVIFIPCIIALTVSGTKIYKNIVKERNRKNIKLEITRHTLFCLIILLFIEMTAFIEAYVSTGLLQICSKYI